MNDETPNPSALAKELEDWLESKGLSPKEATILLTETLAQCIGFCPTDREAMKTHESLER